MNARVPTLQGKPPFPELVDNTQRGEFLKCPTAWARSHCFCIAPLTPSIHLHAGGAFARGLEIARISFDDRGADIAEAMRAGLQALMEFYGDFVAPPTKNGDKSLENVIRAYDSYFQRYPLDRDPLRTYRADNGKLMVEFNFAIPTEVINPSTGNPILYGGRFDRIGVLHGGLYVTDEKTATQLGEQWASQWDLESQFTGYDFACKHYGYPTVGAVIRGVGLLKTKITHAETIIQKPRWHLDRWWRQLQKDLRRMVQQYEEFDFDLALAKGSCSAFGGCQFKILCESPDPEKWMNQYRIRVWNPLAKDQGENLLENPLIKANPEGMTSIDLSELT